MDIYASDEEKGEAIKAWWRDHGASVIVICILGIAIVLGVSYWVTYQHEQTESATTSYQYLMSLTDDEFAEADNKTQHLLNEFAATPYAVFSAFAMAKQAIDRDDAAMATSYLEWIMLNAKLIGQVEIARLRLARLLFTEIDYQSALVLIEKSSAPAFNSLFAELRGDIYIAQGNNKQAEAAYQTALLSLYDTGPGPRQRLLQLKLDDLVGINDE